MLRLSITWTVSRRMRVGMVGVLLLVWLRTPVAFAGGDCEVVRITFDGQNNRMVKLDGEEIVWRGLTDSGKAAVFKQSLQTGERLNLTDGLIGFIGAPSISEGQVAWRVWDRVDTSRIYFWDGKERCVIAEFPSGNFTMPWGYPPSYHSLEPSLDNGQISWAGWDGSDYEIYLWNGQNIRQITDNSIDDYEPQLNDGQISWTGLAGEKPDVFFWNSTSIRNLSNRPGFIDEDSHLMQGKVAWCGWSNKELKNDIFFWDGSSTSVINLPGSDYEPQIDNSGEFITWHNRKGDQFDIYAWNFERVIPVATHPLYSEIGPFANDGRIAFSRDEGLGYDIFIVRFGKNIDMDNDGDVDGMDVSISISILSSQGYNKEDVDASLTDFAVDYGWTRCDSWQ